ncbi:GntR family transcriptional regulator [Jiangella aurantiaca]|uniref:GntR family transcriptional regulator n=2 Tax=Jiangella aurantiaca TaxID=2530373 RepID=A0A4R5AS06_9ACTN|nr:GntR family transcriptional regulator [Jiangella aurantiaca]
MDHRIEPGAEVSIDGIARDFDVSPTPVREALARLESEGLVVKRPLRGYTAAPLFDAEGLRKLFEMRRILEPAAAGLAAGRMTPAAVAALVDD